MVHIYHMLMIHNDEIVSFLPPKKRLRPNIQVVPFKIVNVNQIVKT